ncbi:MAG: nuclear transport factor 2 family protein [Saprospiraceae bacterium]
MLYLRIAFLLLGTLIAQNALAQKEEKAVKAVVNRFFEAMEKKDTALLRSTCTERPVFQTYMNNREGKLELMTEDFSEFVAFVGAPSADKYAEKIAFEGVHVELTMASVWAPYKFYLNGKFLHCGTDSFQLIKKAGEWKIQYILDTRRKNCP